MNELILINQQDIPCSFDAITLILNNEVIAEEDERNDTPTKEIAEQLANALNCELKHIRLTEKQLAEFLAKKRNQEKEFKVFEKYNDDQNDYDEWVQGYTNQDLIEYAQQTDPKATETSDEHSEAIELMRTLVHDINASGGLIEFNDGLLAPAANPSWTDMGENIRAINDFLTSKGKGIKLRTQAVDNTSEEADEL